MNCRKCDVKLNDENKSSSGRICKPCASLMVKNHYKKNGRSYRNKKRKYKEEKQCEWCGETDSRLLEFDHYDPKHKKSTVGQLQSSSSFKEEVKKCRILCIWCHRIHSFNQRQSETENRVKEIKIVEVSEGRICIGPLCKGKLIDISLFYIRKSTGTPKGLCKNCLYIYDMNRRTKTREYVNSIKLSIGECELCSVKVEKGKEVCFDFDHIDRKTKLATISNLSRVKYNLDIKMKIDDEVAKCRLLCCKCHRIHTHKQLNYH